MRQGGKNHERGQKSEKPELLGAAYWEYVVKLEVRHPRPNILGMDDKSFRN